MRHCECVVSRGVGSMQDADVDAETTLTGNEGSQVRIKRLATHNCHYPHKFNHAEVKRITRALLLQARYAPSPDAPASDL